VGFVTPSRPLDVAEKQFDPARLLGTLQRHGVRFIVIGAIAAIAQGYPLPTEDLDVVPDNARDNLERLATALTELVAELRIPGGSYPIELDADFLSRADSWTLATQAGPLDLLFRPSGTQGFHDLRRDAFEVELGTGHPVVVASLRDVIRSKEASARPKDLAQLPALRQTLEVIRGRQTRGEPT